MNSSEWVFESQRFRVQRLRRAIGVQTLVRDIVRHPGAVTILPILDNGHICLIRNYRLSVDETLIELPAGTLEAGEDPLATATRELTEETGFRADHIEKIAEFYLSPGILDEKMHLYLATGLTAGDPAREAGEQIENLIAPLADALQMIVDGTIRDAKTIIGLLMYSRSQ